MQRYKLKVFPITMGKKQNYKYIYNLSFAAGHQEFFNVIMTLGKLGNGIIVTTMICSYSYSSIKIRLYT